MGLSSFPSPGEGVVGVVVMNTVLSVAILKNMVRSVLQQVVGGTNGVSQEDVEEEPSISTSDDEMNGRVSISRFGSLSKEERVGSSSAMKCCVCLCRFRGEEEVTQLLACNHFFHKGCLDKWFANQHSTCPLCRRSIL